MLIVSWLILLICQNYVVGLKAPLPRCVIVAALRVEHLEVLDDVLEAVQQQPSQTPVVILDSSDIQNTPRNVLTEQYMLRDHLVPNEANLFPLTVPSVPVVLFSGTDRQETMGSIRALKSWEGPNPFPTCAFAVCVEPALDKTFERLFDEIQRDYIDEGKGIKHGQSDQQ